MADGELGAIFKGLAKDAADAAGKITESVAKLSEETADIAESNLDSLRSTDAKAADDISSVGQPSLLTSAAGGVDASIAQTVHGQEQLAGRVFDAVDVEIIKSSGRDYEQLYEEGTTAFVAQVGRGKYSVIVTGDDGIVTGMKNLSLNEVKNLARNYGWVGFDPSDL